MGVCCLSHTDRRVLSRLICEWNLYAAWRKARRIHYEPNRAQTCGAHQEEEEGRREAEYNQGAADGFLALRY